MALYEFFCQKCRTEFELRRPMTEAHKPAMCPECGSTTQRLLSSFASKTGDCIQPAKDPFRNYDTLQGGSNTEEMKDTGDLQDSAPPINEAPNAMSQNELHHGRQQVIDNSPAVRPINWLTVGVLFFLLSLTLFGLESHAWQVKVAGVGALLLSILSFVMIILRYLPLAKIPITGTLSANAHFTDAGKNVSDTLWFPLSLAYLFAFVVTLAMGEANMKWNPSALLVDATAVGWFFLLATVFIATATTRGPKAERDTASRPSWQRRCLWAILLALSTGVIALGARQMWTSKTYSMLFFDGLLLVVVGIAFPVALALIQWQVKRVWRKAITFLIISLAALLIIIPGVLETAHGQLLAGLLAIALGSMVFLLTAYPQLSQALSQLSPF